MVKNFKFEGGYLVDFYKHYDPNNKERLFSVRKTVLIPTRSMTGDESALASVFLSTLRLVKEFREIFFRDVKLKSVNSIEAYREISFLSSNTVGNKKLRPDGLVVSVRGKNIVDSCLFEFKSKGEKIVEDQVRSYCNLAEEYGISKVITISNEQVASSSSSIVDVKNKKIQLFHFSWAHILNMADLLLFNNDMNIADPDQVEIMKEVVSYMRSPESGVKSFDRMEQGWGKVINKIRQGLYFDRDNEDVHEAISSWEQEEVDNSYKLSSALGVFVKPYLKKEHLESRKKRLEDALKSLIDEKKLYSCYRIDKSLSDMNVMADLGKNIIELSTKLSVPDESFVRQLSWINREFENCKKKARSEIQYIFEKIYVHLYFKGLRGSNSERRIPLAGLDSLKQMKDSFPQGIREYDFVFSKDLSKEMRSSSKFIEVYEAVTIDFYEAVMQNLRQVPVENPKKITENISTGSESTSIKAEQQMILEPAKYVKKVIEEVELNNSYIEEMGEEKDKAS